MDTETIRKIIYKAIAPTVLSFSVDFLLKITKRTMIIQIIKIVNIY